MSEENEPVPAPSPTPAKAEKAASEAVVYDLERCVKMARNYSPEIRSAAMEKKGYEAKVEEAKAAHVLPQLELRSLIGPSPEMRGTLVDDINGVYDGVHFDEWSVFTKTDISAIQPVYTFGKLSSALDAARKLVMVGEAGVQKKALEVDSRVRQLYFGILLGDALKKVFDEVMSKCRAATDLINKKLEEETGEVTHQDLYQVEVFEFSLVKMLEEINDKSALAASTLKLLMGLETSAPMTLADKHLKPVDPPAVSLDEYIELALEDRPDIAQVEAGISAREAQVNMVKADYLPQFFIAAGFGYSYAPNRSDPDSRWVSDGLNSRSQYVAFGFKQNLSFFGTHAKVSEARAQYEKLLRDRESLRMSIKIEVEEAWRNYERAKRVYEEARRALRTGKKWFRSSTLSYAIGVVSTRDLVDAYRGYITTKGEYYKAIFDLNSAYVKLVQSTGIEYAAGAGKEEEE